MSDLPHLLAELPLLSWGDAGVAVDVKIFPAIRITWSQMLHQVDAELVDTAA